MARVAVVLMNLGGPDSLEAVRPFLVNLFDDPAIIGLPGPLRRPLARLIAWRRGPVAREIYARLGGRSPLLGNTNAQARALEGVLGSGYRCFVAMRYWHPSSGETAREVSDWAPDEIVCLPLYPQFSTTTTASSLTSWQLAAKQQGLDCPTRCVRCYPSEKGLIEGLVHLIRSALDTAPMTERSPRLLLTAHGLPMKIVRAGDPYPGQVEQTAAAVVEALDKPGLDWRVCYQSRVGPLRWLEPATDEEIKRAGREGVSLVVAPISFVSEHSETLVELDLDYRDLAVASGVPAYHRVATVGIEPAFIGALASLVRRALSGSFGLTGWLAYAYLWIKSFHIISMIAWMAGLLYLPRLFVYHSMAPVGSNGAATFKVMERRLLRGIMNPAMVATWLFGLALAGTPGIVDWRMGWIWAKLVLVAGLTVFHGLLVCWQNAFSADHNMHSTRFFRGVNELPTVALIGIVLLVVVKPF